MEARCQICGKTRVLFRTQDNLLVCLDCAEKECKFCSICGAIMHYEHNYMIDAKGNIVCYRCYIEHIVRCSRCRCFVLRSRTQTLDDEKFCLECYLEELEAEISRVYIHPYEYKPIPIYHGDFEADLLLGIELEIDLGGQDHKVAKRLLKIANGSFDKEENIYIKYEPTARSGFEIVSQPCTLDYHLRTIPWKKMFDWLRSKKYRSGATKTCGLHIHVNRLFFGKTEAEITRVEANLLCFFEKYWDKLVMLSRRQEKEIIAWCKRYGHNNYRLALEENRYFRYYALNFKNTTTVEFRLFKGTLVYEIFEATLRLIANMVQYCKLRDVGAESWLSFQNFLIRNEYENWALIQYMKARRVWED